MLNMRKDYTIKKIALVMVFTIIITVLSGCSESQIGSFKQEIPKPRYDRIGYAIDTKVDGDNVTLTYAVVGFKEDKFIFLELDQIEKTLGDEKSLSTNKELGTAYGLAYTSDLGEWNVQVKALLNYIAGNSLSADEIAAIKTYKKDENNPSVPAPDTDLSAACELNIGEYIDVIAKACNNTVEVEAMYLGYGENIRINNLEKRITVDFCVLAFDYNGRIVSSDLVRCEATASEGEFTVTQGIASEDKSSLQNNLAGYSQYMLGRTVNEVLSAEVYDPGDGISTAVPKPGTDLAEVCNIDLASWSKAVREASERAW